MPGNAYQVVMPLKTCNRQQIRQAYVPRQNLGRAYVQVGGRTTQALKARINIAQG